MARPLDWIWFVPLHNLRKNEIKLTICDEIMNIKLIWFCCLYASKLVKIGFVCMIWFGNLCIHIDTHVYIILRGYVPHWKLVSIVIYVDECKRIFAWIFWFVYPTADCDELATNDAKLMTKSFELLQRYLRCNSFCVVLDENVNLSNTHQIVAAATSLCRKRDGTLQSNYHLMSPQQNQWCKRSFRTALNPILECWQEGPLLLVICAQFHQMHIANDVRSILEQRINQQPPRFSPWWRLGFRDCSNVQTMLYCHMLADRQGIEAQWLLLPPIEYVVFIAIN